MTMTTQAHDLQNDDEHNLHCVAATKKLEKLRNGLLSCAQISY